MGKKRNTEPHREPSQSPPFVRIEIHADPDWAELLDAAAKALGISRSAYMRMACNRQMDADRRAKSSED